jgi:hypothetical protein
VFKLKKSKRKIISLIIILIILTSGILQAVNAIDLQSKNDTNSKTTIDYGKCLYDVVQASMLMENQENLKIENVKDINKTKPTENGIWVEENSREYFLELLNSVEEMNFTIGNDGYLKLDGENQKQSDYVSISLRRLIDINRTISISIQSTFLSYEEEVDDIITKTISDKEYYIQLIDEKNSKNEVLLLNKSYYSNTNNENTKEELLRYILQIYYEDDITSEITEGLETHLSSISNVANINSQIKTQRSNSVTTNIYIEEENRETILTFINLNSKLLYNVNSNGYLIYNNASIDDSQMDSEIRQKVTNDEEIVIEFNSNKFLGQDSEYVKSEVINGVKNIYLNPLYFNNSTVFFDNNVLRDAFTQHLMSIDENTKSEMLLEAYNEIQTIKATETETEETEGRT